MSTSISASFKEVILSISAKACDNSSDRCPIYYSSSVEMLALLSFFKFERVGNNISLDIARSSSFLPIT